ncbi:rCG56175 [Rattus norvegicus]|uniref:RCG56175 n=1 Tax=Rattus norvegicus TaxID=10116 RepID=A6IBJ2_RAT|nr:rCG56175 [Rattus norvegicus]
MNVIYHLQWSPCSIHSVLSQVPDCISDPNLGGIRPTWKETVARFVRDC